MKEVILVISYTKSSISTLSKSFPSANSRQGVVMRKRKWRRRAQSATTSVCNARRMKRKANSDHRDISSSKMLLAVKNPSVDPPDSQMLKATGARTLHVRVGKERDGLVFRGEAVDKKLA